MRAWMILLATTLLPGLVAGQWVHFRDRTAERLVLGSVPDGDGMEKDLAVGDFDRDGWDDVVVVRKTPFSIPGGQADLLLMNDEGTLRDRTSEFAPEFLTNLTDARDVFVTDVDGDQWPDLVVANTFGQQPVCYRNQGAGADGKWLGFADETAERFPELTIPKLQFCAVCAGDVTGDGAPDIYFSNYVRRPEVALDVLLINDGTGHFTDETDVRLGDRRNSAFGTQIDLRDMDHDGDLDIIKTSSLDAVAPWNEVGIFVVFNEGDGTFRAFQSIPSESPYMFAVDDLTNDGLLDVYVVNDSQDFAVKGVSADADRPQPLHFEKVVLDSPRTGFLGGNVQCADFDGDGDLDVAVADVDIDLGICETGADDPRKFALLRNEGLATGELTDPWGADSNIWNQNVFDFAVLDLNRDGKLDFVAGLCAGYGVWQQENTLHVPEKDLDFGVAIAGTNSVLTVRVCNNGTEPREVLGISASEPEFEVEGDGFSLEPYECVTVEVAFAPKVPGSFAGVLRIGGAEPKEIPLRGVAQTPPEVTLSEESIAVRSPAGGTERRVITLSNTGGSALEVEAQIRIPGQPRVLLLAEASARSLLEDALEEAGVFYAVGDLASVDPGTLQEYEVLVVATVAGPVTEENFAALTGAMEGGKTVLFLGATTDSDYLSGLQGVLSHQDEPGWKEPGRPHFRVVDVDHPLIDGLPAEYDFVSGASSWYRIQPNDEDSWVAAENGDGVPCLLSKRVGAGQLMYFTNWPLSVVWSSSTDAQFMFSVVRNAIGLSQTAWLSVKPRESEIGVGLSGEMEFVFHTAGRSPGTAVVDVVLTTSDPVWPEIVIPVSLEVLQAPFELPELRIREVDEVSVRLDLFGESGTRYRIESSTDLQNWRAEEEAGFTGAVLTIELERVSSEQARYYRAVELGR